MKFFNALALLAILGLAHGSHAQSQAQPPDTPTLNAKFVSGLVGMKVTSADGVTIGTVKDVVVDGYGQATHAIIAYGGMMGLGNTYTAVPWATVAQLLDRDKLVMDASQLTNAPTLSGAKPDSANLSWRRDADRYWRGKVAMAN